MFSKGSLLGLVFGLITLYIIAALYESKGTREQIRKLYRQWCKRNLFERLSILAVIAMLTIYAGTKPDGTGYEPSSYVVSLPDVGLVQDGSAMLSGGISIEDAPMSSENPELTQAQMINGYALTQVSTGTVSWHRYPENYTVVSNWLAYGVHDDVQHLKLDPQFPIHYSTNSASDLWVSSSGTLSFDAVKGSPFISTNGLPDGSLIPYAAVLHGPLSIIPPESRVWHAASTINYCVTWENLYAGRQTNNPVTFQMEVLANQDIIYRYLLGSNTVNSQTLTNFLVGLQANTPEGGESLRFSSINTTPEIFELYWTYFGYLDPAISDHDNDGLTSSAEIFIYKTDPHMQDTDLDGLSDAQEVELGTNPNNPDTDGDGIPDGAEAPGQALVFNTTDDDADGLPDSWEEHWLGSTGTTDNAYGDYNSDGMANIVNLLTATDPFAIPPPGFAVTNGVQSVGYDVWQIAPAFSMQLPIGLTNILTRTLQIDRTSPWQQFFISSDINAGAPWSLDGLSLTWKGGVNLEQSAISSSASDSLWLELGTNLVSSLTFTLGASRTNGYVYCSKPLYLIRWTPELTFTEAGNIKIVTHDNKRYATSILAAPDAAALPFLINNPMPHNESTVGQGLLRQLAQPPYADSKIYPVFSENLTGYLTAHSPATGELPAAAGNLPVSILLYNPVVKSNNGITVGRPFGALSSPYPLNSAATRRTWRNNAEATGTLSGSIEVSLGVDCDFVDITLNGVSFDSPDPQTYGVTTLGAPAGGCTQHCECSDDNHIDINIFGECIWHHCEPTEEEEDEGEYESSPPPDEECDDCDCSSDGPQQSSLKFRVKLGEPGYDQVSGYLWFAFETPVPITANIFQILSGPNVNISITNGVTYITSSAPDGNPLLRTIENISSGVCIKLYNSEGDYDHMWQITNPGNNSNIVHIIKSKNRTGSTQPTVVLSETHTYDQENGAWIKTDNLRHFSKTLTFSGDLEVNGWHYEATALKDHTGKTLAATAIKRSVMGMGESAITRITWQQTWDGYASCYLTQSSLYWSDNQSSRLHGSLKLRYGDDTPWEYHFCDNRGRTLLNVGPLNGSPHPAIMESSDEVETIENLKNIAGLSCTAELNSYTPLDGTGDTRSSKDSRKPRKTEKYIIENGNAILTAREWHIYKREMGDKYVQLTHIAIRAASQGSAMNDAANQATITVSISDDPANALILRGRPLMQRNPDNTQTTYEYDLDQINDELIITTHNGTTDSPQGIAGKSTYTIEYIDANYGRTIALEKYLYAGEQAADVLLEFEHSYYNSEDRLISTEYSDGTFSSNLWNCCYITNTIARDGIVIAYNEWPSNPAESEVVYLSQGQLPGAAGNHSVHYIRSDAIGREIESASYVADPQFGFHFGYAEQVTKTDYPFGTDNFSVTTDPLGICTTNITTWRVATNITITSRAGITTTSEAIAGGANITTTEWTDSVSDKKLKKMTKTESDIQPNGWRKTTAYVKYDDGEWLTQSETVSDLLGQAVTSSRAGTGGAMLVTSNVYNNVGQLIQTISYNGASTVFDYNELGERTATISVAAGQTLDFDPQSFTLDAVIVLDKYAINLTTENTENTEEEWWNCSATIVYSPGHSAQTTSVQRVQLTGLTLECNSRSVSIDANGNTIINTESVDPVNASKVVTSVNTTLGITNVSHFVAGYETCATNSLGGVTKHFYDGFSRRTKTTNYANERELQSVTTYHDDGSIATVGQITANGTNTTSYSTQHSVDGKPGAYKITVTDPQGKQTVNYYSGNGQLYRSEGATYPNETAFDAAGRMAELHTWRDETGNSDITRWYYDPYTGAVTSKVYADGKGTAYIYFNDGRMATREWARGVTTTYGYSDTATGSIRTTDYNDDTPSVTNYYNLVGQLVKVEDGSGTTTFSYDSKGRQITETNAFAVITRSYDQYGRYSEFILNPVNPVYPVQKIIFGYDKQNRLNSITSIVGVETNVFTYSYLSGTQLINGYTATTTSAPSTALIVTRTYEPNRDIFSTVTNSFVALVPSVVSSFNYHNDSTGKRTSRIDFYNGSAVTNTFDYNNRSEVTNSVMNFDEHSIVYDDIGNREQSTVYSGQSTVTNIYMSNQLNQYTSVRTNGIYRGISHDSDGNLRSDGYWTYTWNAENRPTDIYRSLYQATNDDIRVEIKYDYRNRRIERKITKFRMTEQIQITPFVDGVWDSVRTHNYIWDGWNIAAEIIIDHVTPTTNISYYTWGLDLSGTLQGAGGVGGLLCDTKVTNLGTNAHFAVGDANGNITEYVDVSGTIVAHGEHNSFGETELSGSMKDGFTHWFSSKPLDAETRLVQYQLRPYSPELGIFLPRDLSGIKGGYKENGFVNNNPINQWDYLGMWPWEGCCNGNKYNKFKECCCDKGKIKDGSSGCDILKKEKIVTGIRKCDIAAYKNPSGYPHGWLEVDKFSAGFGPASLENGAQGFISIPDSRPGGLCFDVKLNPCEYNIETVKQAVKQLSLAAQFYPPPYSRSWSDFYVCYTWRDDVIKRALKMGEKKCGKPKTVIRLY